MKISVTILTKDSALYLKEILQALLAFDEVVVVDTGSKDPTMEIARQFPNVSLYQSAFIGFGPLHNRASLQARNEWILSLDSDEVPTKELVQEIEALALDPLFVYSFERKNYYRGKQIKWCGWYPERVRRLYNKKKTSFSPLQVHEAIEMQGVTERRLRGAVCHYPYRSIADFLTKMQHYSDLFVEENRGKPSSPLKAIGHGFFAFFKSYVLKRGVLGGYEGFLISVYNGHTAFYKYLKLYENK